jgi:signal transduction histidine kinase
MSPLKYGEDESLHGYMIQMVDITDRVLAEKAVEKRVKELTCLLGTSQLASKSELALDAFLKGVVKLLPPAWFHAEIACARILLDGLVFTTSNFKETKWKGVTDITVGKERRGAIEIYYLEQKPELDEGPFLKEERALIDSIAELVGNAVGRWQAEEALRELTEELEQRVRKRTQELAASNQELESFAYSVSHDLRSPLRGIAGFSMAVLEDYSDVLDETAHDYLNRMHKGAVRMSELIDDILSLSQVSRGEMHSEVIDMTALALTIAEELRSQEPGRKAKLVISDNLEAYGDTRLMYLVLENLLGNAWKFTRKQRSTRIEFGATEQENETVFFVRDNGVGFDMKYIDKLFDVFQRLHHADEFEGTGIGLAIVTRIIGRHGGRTWAEGNVGTGATFYFTLPSEGSEL